MPPRALTLLTVFCLIHVLLISAQVQSKSGVPVIQTVSFGAFASLQRAMASVGDTVGGVWGGYFALRGAAEENEQLKRRVLDLEAELQQQRAAASRARAMEELLALRKSEQLPTITARVIAGNPSPGSLTVTIDRGTSDGVRVDMPVIAARGVVGRVIAPVAPRAATVQLLTGRNAAAAVTFERSAAGGIVVGGAASDPPLRAEYVPVLAEIQIGERVSTSGQDGIYPAGYLVGTVERVTRGATGAEREIAIRPSVDFSHIDLVVVIQSTPAQPGAGS